VIRDMKDELLLIFHVLTEVTVMGKVIHFYEYESDISVLHSWNATKNQMKLGESTIHTTQMGFLHTRFSALSTRFLFMNVKTNLIKLSLAAEMKERTGK